MTGKIRSLDSTGDTLLAEWDVNDKLSTKRANDIFNALVASGALLSRCDEGTDLTGEQVREFDPQAQDIIAFSPFKGG